MIELLLPLLALIALAYAVVLMLNQPAESGLQPVMLQQRHLINPRRRSEV